MTDAARLIETAVADCCADDSLRSKEFGGDMGFTDMMKAVLSYTARADIA